MEEEIVQEANQHMDKAMEAFRRDLAGIRTGRASTSMLNGVRIAMQEGECWYHNFNLPHHIANRGATDRVHLVIDCEINEWLRELLVTADQAATKPPGTSTARS